MQLPHKITLVVPAEVADEYGNPTPRLDYTRGRRCEAWALLQPLRHRHIQATLRFVEVRDGSGTAV